jgi:hypothetical protein
MAGAWIAPSCKSQKTSDLSRPLFLSTICDAPTLRHIGKTYRTTTPTEAEEQKLITLLDTAGSQTSDLDHKVREDYAAGRTLTIDGWMISVTEARQCALYSLQNP